MAMKSLSHRASQSASQAVQQSATQIANSIREVYEKWDFHAFDGPWEYEETEWESPTVLLVKGSMEMESDSGLVLRVPFSCRIEFGQHSLEMDNVKPSGLVV